MKSITKTSIILSLVFLWSCVSVKDASEKETKWKPNVEVHAGINKGGITENNNFSELDDIPVDAFSGATNTGLNVGVHTEAPLIFNYIETGIDYMYNKQVFTYNDEVRTYSGKRNIGVSQFMLPVTYNLTFFKKQQKGGLFQFKLGFLLQYNILNVNDIDVGLPAYGTNNFSNGILFGFETTPIEFSNGGFLGFYADLYRGSQIYKDFYNQDSFEIPGSSFFKAGIIYQFNLK